MPFLLFGYGSLISNPSMIGDPSICKVQNVHDGYIRGFRRCWHQGSTDHRGVPGAPGRTVTLTVDASSYVMGRAFKIDDEPEREKVAMAYLEHREKQYDQRLEVPFYAGPPPPPGCDDVDDEPLGTCLVFVGTPNENANVNYLGPPESMASLARQIASARGPSGHNREYLYALSGAMRSFMDGEFAHHDRRAHEIFQAADFHGQAEALKDDAYEELTSLFLLERLVKAYSELDPEKVDYTSNL